MRNELIMFETAKLAKEKGFNEDCEYIFESETEIRRLNYYEGDGSNFVKNLDINNDYESFILTNPSQSFLQRWLREVHNIHVEVLLINTIGLNVKHIGRVSFIKNYIWEYISLNKVFDTFEETTEEGLKEALKLIK